MDVKLYKGVILKHADVFLCVRQTLEYKIVHLHLFIIKTKVKGFFQTTLVQQSLHF